jgi:hypothetical protein
VDEEWGKREPGRVAPLVGLDCSCGGRGRGGRTGALRAAEEATSAVMEGERTEREALLSRCST